MENFMSFQVSGEKKYQLQLIFKYFCKLFVFNLWIMAFITESK